MSASFTNQTLAQIELCDQAGQVREEGLHAAQALDEKVARLHLDKIGVKLTKLSDKQADLYRRAAAGPVQGRTITATSIFNTFCARHGRACAGHFVCGLRILPDVPAPL